MDALNDLLKSFVTHRQKILGDNLIGIYLHGPAVMGCYNEKKSDIDLLVVVTGEIHYVIYGRNRCSACRCTENETLCRTTAKEKTVVQAAKLQHIWRNAIEQRRLGIMSCL